MSLESRGSLWLTWSRAWREVRNSRRCRSGLPSCLSCAVVPRSEAEGSLPPLARRPSFGLRFAVSTQGVRVPAVPEGLRHARLAIGSNLSPVRVQVMERDESLMVLVPTVVADSWRTGTFRVGWHSGATSSNDRRSGLQPGLCHHRSKSGGWSAGDQASVGRQSERAWNRMRWRNSSRRSESVVVPAARGPIPGSSDPLPACYGCHARSPNRRDVNLARHRSRPRVACAGRQFTSFPVAVPSPSCPSSGALPLPSVLPSERVHALTRTPQRASDPVLGHG